MRRDAWWVQPAIVFVVLSSFLVYATWAAFQNAHYEYGNYLSPFYSPLLFSDSAPSWFGPRPGWWPGFLPFSTALIILPFPAGFRFTCYYYRGAYYKAFWQDPVSCTVGEPRKSYLGEKSFPLILQNVHRYFLYFALIFLLFLAHDAWKAMWFADPATGATHFGIGLGTLLITANVILLGGYTLGCHSLRHLVGGYRDRLAGAPARKKVYDCASCLNRGHGRWAWFSLFMVAFCDIYIRLLSMGVWTDVRFF
ncbi:MAG: succinate dehydrogenase [Gemmatimonadaceae bacterium]